MVFAPVPRDYSFKLNKKEKRAALKSALTSRVQENKLIVVEELKFDEIKTKNFKKVMDNLNVNKALVILGDKNENAVLSARNIPTLLVLPSRFMVLTLATFVPSNIFSTASLIIDLFASG